MPVRKARRAAKAANLVRSAMDPRDIDALDPSESAGAVPLGMRQDSAQRESGPSNGEIAR